VQSFSEKSTGLEIRNFVVNCCQNLWQVSARQIVTMIETIRANIESDPEFLQAAEEFKDTYDVLIW
jgi:hypothetical protein